MFGSYGPRLKYRPGIQPRCSDGVYGRVYCRGMLGCFGPRCFYWLSGHDNIYGAVTTPVAALIADARLAAWARAAIIGQGHSYGTATMPMATLITDARLAASARAAFIGHGWSYGTMATPMATLTASSRLAPLARAAIAGQGYTYASVTTPGATLFAGARRLLGTRCFCWPWI